MSDYQTFDIVPDFSIEVDENATPFALSSDDVARVEAIWQEEKKKKGERLFNGRMLIYLKHSMTSLWGSFVDYKYYIAGLRDSSLRQKMNLRTIGASGITRSGNCVLWGRRASFVTEYPGYYECAPSGGINPEMALEGCISVKEAFIQELTEETRIPATLVEKIVPRWIVYDSQAKLYEIVALIDLDSSVKHLTLSATDEYDELLWIEMDNLSLFFEGRGEKILPASRYFLQSIKVG